MGVVDLLTPCVTAIVDSSLSPGQLPESHKLAIMLPRLKKPGLATADMMNFQPVSNLSFLSKVIERAATWQLNETSLDRDGHAASHGRHTERRRWSTCDITRSA